MPDARVRAGDPRSAGRCRGCASGRRLAFPRAASPVGRSPSNTLSLAAAGRCRAGRAQAGRQIAGSGLQRLAVGCGAGDPGQRVAAARRRSRCRDRAWRDGRLPCGHPLQRGPSRCDLELSVTARGFSALRAAATMRAREASSATSPVSVTPLASRTACQGAEPSRGRSPPAVAPGSKGRAQSGTGVGGAVFMASSGTGASGE